MAQIKKINFTLDSEYNGKIIRDMSDVEKSHLIEYFADKGTECIIDGFNNTPCQSDVARLMESISPQVEALTMEDEHAFLALGADQHDITACFRGTSKSMVAMVASHMLCNNKLAQVILASVKLYAEHLDEFKSEREE